MRRPENQRVGAILLTYLTLVASCQQYQVDSPGKTNERQVAQRVDALPGAPSSGYSRTTTETFPVAGGLRAAGLTSFQTAVSADGQGTVNVPLWTPPGRNGSGPSLALTYNSAWSNGGFGMGWAVVGFESMISACASTPSNRGMWSEVALDSFCLDGTRLVPAETSTFRLPMQPDSRITRTGNSWKIENGDGSFSHYTQSEFTQKWRLTRTVDRAGNVVEAVYTHGLLSSLEFGGHTSSQAGHSRRIRFVSESRAQSLVSSFKGETFELTKRVSKIEIQAPAGITGSGAPSAPVTVREYRLTYDAAPGPGFDRLKSLTECDGTGACLAPVSFAYEGNGGVALSAESALFGGGLPGNLLRLVPADMNGDGLVDLFGLFDQGGSRTWSVRTQTSPGVWSSGWVQILAQHDGSRQDLFPSWAANSPLPLSSIPSADGDVGVLDLDGDGIPELLAPRTSHISGVVTTFTMVATRTGSVGASPLYTLRPPSLSPFATFGYFTQASKPELVDADYDQPRLPYPSTDPANPASTYNPRYHFLNTVRAIDWRGSLSSSGTFSNRRLIRGRQCTPNDGWVFIKGHKHSDGTPRPNQWYTTNAAPDQPVATESAVGPGSDRHWGYWNGALMERNDCGASDFYRSFDDPRGYLWEGAQISSDGLTVRPPVANGEMRFVRGFHRPRRALVFQWPLPPVPYRGDRPYQDLWGGVRRTDQWPVSSDFDGNGLDEILFRDLTTPTSMMDKVWSEGIYQHPSLLHVEYLVRAERRYTRWSGLASGPSGPFDEVGQSSPLELDEPSTVVPERAFSVADLDDDQFPDLIARRKDSFEFWRNDGAGTFALRGTVAFGGGSLFRMLDIDQDGTDDLIDFTGGRYVSGRRCSGSCTWSAVATLGTSWGTNPAYTLKLSDLNADGLADVLYAQNGFIAVRYGESRPAGLLVSVETERQSERFTYRAISEKFGADRVYEPGPSCEEGFTCLKAGFRVVAQHLVRAEDPGRVVTPRDFTSTFRYFDGRIDKNGNGWLGFRRVVETQLPSGKQIERQYGVASADRVRVSGSNVGFFPFSRTARRIVECTDLRSSPSESGALHLVESTFSREFAETTIGAERHLIGAREVSNTSTGERPLAANAVALCGSVTWLTSSQALTHRTNGRVTRFSTRYWQGGFASGQQVPVSPPGGLWGDDTTFEHSPATETPWLSGLVSRTETRSVADGITSSPQVMSFTYRSGTALLETATQAPDSIVVEAPAVSGEKFTKTLEYDTRNNPKAVVLSSPGFDTRRTEIDYDEEQYYPKTIRRFRGVTSQGALVEHTYFDRAFGELVESESPNGARVLRRIDGFGRTTSVQHPGQVGFRTRYVLGNGETRVETEGGTGKALGKSVAVLDFRLRPVRSQVDEELNGISGVVIHEVETDPFARLSRRSYPFRPGETPEYQTTNFDKLGRPVSALDTAAGTQETVSYEGLVARYLAADGLATEVVFDAMGRRVQERNFPNPNGGPFSGLPLTTQFRFGHFGSLQAVVDAAGGQTVFNYDNYGRRTATLFPESGLSASYFNALGEEKRVVDARGATITTARDRLGRITNKTISNWAAGAQSSAEIYEWDTRPNGDGLLSAVTSSDGIRQDYYYDLHERVNELKYTVPVTGSNREFRSLIAYDLEGRPSGILHPNGMAFSTEFTAVGAAKSLSLILASGNTQRLLSIIQRDSSGQVLMEQYGNEVSTKRVLDRAKRLTYQTTYKSQQLQNLQPGQPLADVPFQRTKYVYHPSGRLSERHDLPLATGESQQSEYYTYDRLGRLDEWRVDTNQVAIQSCTTRRTKFSYDAFGNLTQRRFVDASGSTVEPTRALTSSFQTLSSGQRVLATQTQGTLPASAYTYDASGNQIGLFYQRVPSGVADRRISWNAWGKPSRIEDSQSATEYLYDSSGARVVERTGSLTRITLPTGYELQINAGAETTTLNGLFGGRVVSQVSSSGSSVTVKYLHHDRLGNPDLVTSGMPGQGAVDERWRYEPFGGSRQYFDLTAPSPRIHSSTQGFTGHQSDDRHTLVNMKGRVYEPGLGRFLSPDPLAGHSPSSQGFNRYAYALNDPVNIVDPNGLEPISITAAIIIGFFVAGTGVAIVASLAGQATSSSSHIGPGPTVQEVSRFNTPSGSPGPTTGTPPAPGGTAPPPAAPPSAADQRERELDAIEAGLGFFEPVLGPSAGIAKGTLAMTRSQMRDGVGFGDAIATALNANLNPMWGAAESLYKAEEAYDKGDGLAAFGYGMKATGQTALAALSVYGGVKAIGVTAGVRQGVSRELSKLATGGGGEMASLYRAVGDAELGVIRSTGRIPASLSGLEVKYFSATPEGAASYARQAVRGFGDAPYTLVETQVPRSALPADVLLQVDRNVPAVVLPNTHLPLLGPAKVWPFMPVP